MVNDTDVMLSSFRPVWGDILAHGHTHYWLKGGRGSTKSSFISIVIIILVMMFPFANAVIVRKVSNTLRDSVYQQLLWAIDVLGVNQYFYAGLSPLELRYLPTGQRIVFRGTDDPLKLKGTKFVKGYCAIVWFEELDQFANIEEIRSILNSLRRGGDKFWVFYSYNPPRTRWNWVNKEALAREQREDTLVHHSSYLDVAQEHPEWIGRPFIEEAELLKQQNPMAYAWEYLGEITGTGGSVFENIVKRRVTDEEIATFDNPRYGIDFGWFPDPWRFVQCEWQPGNRRLVIFGERSANKKTTGQTAEIVREAQKYAGAYHTETIWCDSANIEEINAYKREYGLNTRPAEKGNMRKASYVWLAGLREIVIDPVRCPLTFEEFALCEFAKDKNGEWVEDFNDGNDHSIDAVRYAVMRDVKRDR